jgi:anti-anti-sigma regulatory factor
MSDFVLERVGPKVKVIVGRALSAAVVPGLFELLCAIQDDGVNDLTLDFSQTTLLDASGLHLLLVANNSFSGDHRSMQLVQVPLEIWSLLEILQLSKRLHAQMA